MAEEPRGFNPDWKDPREPGPDPVPVGSQAPTPTVGMPPDSLPPQLKGGDGLSVDYDGHAYVVRMDLSEAETIAPLGTGLFTPVWRGEDGRFFRVDFTQLQARLASVEAKVDDANGIALPDKAVTWPKLADDISAAIQDRSWANITDAPETATRWPAWDEVTGKPETATRWPAWDEVTGKPETATRWPAWGEVTGKPTSFTPSAHSHAQADITNLVTDLANRPTTGSTPRFAGVTIGPDSDVYLYEDTNGLWLRIGAAGAYKYINFRNDGTILSGTTQLATDGNVYGSVWGNQWLSNYLNGQFAAKANLTGATFSGANKYAQPYMKAWRGAGWETLTPGDYGILGSFAVQEGGFYQGSNVGNSGSAIHVPLTGKYLLINRVYSSQSSGGRINLCVAGLGAVSFVHNRGSTTVSDFTQTDVAVATLYAGNYLYYNISSATANVFTGGGHTLVEAYYLG